MIGKKEHSAGGSPHTSHHIPSLMFHTICLCRNNWGVTDTMCTDAQARRLERGNWAAGHGQQCHPDSPSCPLHAGKVAAYEEAEIIISLFLPSCRDPYKDWKLGRSYLFTTITEEKTVISGFGVFFFSLHINTLFQPG